MKQIKIGNKEILLVEVIGNMPLMVNGNRLEYGTRIHGKFSLLLPSTGWRILGSGKADAITEEEWGEVVEVIHRDSKIDWDVIEGWIYGNINKDYEHEDEKDKEWMPYNTRAESGHSLLSLHNFNLSSTVVLIKQ